MKMRLLSLFLTVPVIAFGFPVGDSTRIIDLFLKSYNTGQIDSINAFIKRHYQPKITDSKENFERVSLSFGTLYDEFGPLLNYSSEYDTTYKTNKYYLQGLFTKEWVAVLFVMNRDNSKVLGQGIYKLQQPKAWKPQPLSMKGLPGYLNKYLEELSRHNLFSGSVLVAHKNKIIYNRAWGKKNERKKIDIFSRFPIASITKLFTGIAITQLIEQGKVKPDDHIGKYIKEYPKDISEQVTVRQLLLHTSGIEMDDAQGFRERRSGVKSMKELIQLHVRFLDSLNEGRRTNFKPLGRYDYSNENYDLLSMIIEKASGLSMANYIQEHICKPAHMLSTGFGADTTMLGYSHYDVSHGNRYYPTQWYTYMFIDSSFPSGAGGLYSTTSDLYRLYQALRNRKLFKSAWQQVLLRDTSQINRRDYYGYGLEAKYFGEQLSYGHNGGLITGVNAEFRYFPQLDLFIVVICNRSRTASDLVYHTVSRLTD